MLHAPVTGVQRQTNTSHSHSRGREVQFHATSSERSSLPETKREPPPEPEPLPPTTTEGKRERESRLDENQNFFDFNKLLSTTVKPQKTHESLKLPTQESMKTPTHESMKMPTHESMKLPTHEPMKLPIQSVGAWGIAPSKTQPIASTQRSFMEPEWGREPRIVNRPLTTPRSRPQRPNNSNFNTNPSPNNNNLIHLVNDRLREQGMQIEPAREVPMVLQTTPTPTPAPTPTQLIDPFEPYRFRGQDRDKDTQPQEPWNDVSNNLDVRSIRRTSVYSEQWTMDIGIAGCGDVGLCIACSTFDFVVFAMGNYCGRPEAD